MNDVGSLLIEASTLMVTGMLVVFLFLTIMVYAVALMSKVVPAETPALPIIPAKTKIVTDSSNNENDPQPEVVAAITAAIHQYRSSTTHSKL